MSRSTKYLLLLWLIVNIIITTNAQLDNNDIQFNQIFENYPNIEVKLVELNNELVVSNVGHSEGNNLVQPIMTPVVFWHGMGDTAYGSIEVDRMALLKKYPNISVFSVQIGNNPLEDAIAGYLVNANYQVAGVCREILKNKMIRNAGSFNAVGFSQGAQFMRALIERCPFRENGIKVKNFISLGGQHQGVYGLPNCEETVFCDYIRHLLTYATYEDTVQEHIVQAEYWHDPRREDEYKRKSLFLADINNEIRVNNTYKNNLMALDNLVLVKFANDDMVIPRESSLFGFYEPGQTEKIINLEETNLYLEDRLGLKKMKESGKLHMITVPGRHLQYRMSWFVEKIAEVYLNN